MIRFVSPRRHSFVKQKTKVQLSTRVTRTSTLLQTKLPSVPVILASCKTTSRTISQSFPTRQKPAIRRPELKPSQPAAVYDAMDGNECAAYVAYGLSDISFIYPISPATSMGEHMDKWASSGKKNTFGQTVDVNMMQSEGGAAGALHGAAAAGALSSTFTASQGLLLMIPNMYLLAGELCPTVFHVSARTVAKHALSIFNDHSDVMATRQTGFALLCSSSVQEVMDLGLAAHVSSIKARLPFLHFFDGLRTSAEISKIQPIPYEDIKQIFPYEYVKHHLHDFALNPNNPLIRGTGQRPDIFFQSTVAAHKYYKQCPELVEETLRDIEALTGRRYNLFDYHGSQNADRIIVIMGSASKTVEETVDYMNANGENVGVVTVRLFRPWSAKHFLRVVPKTVHKVAVLDRTREEGATGNPLFLDVHVTFSDASNPKLITGGQYGLASKEFDPSMVKAVFDNLNAAKPMNQYVIGVDDDVTFSSLGYGAPLNTLPANTKQCVFWGLGSDGTIGSSKQAIKTIGLNTDLYAQGHFVYDSHKADGVTISHVRFGPSPIKSEYEIQSNADYVSCSHPSYVYKFDQMIDPLKEGGIFVLNSPWSTVEEMSRKLQAKIKRNIASKKIQFYTIDATSLAAKVGLGKRINMIMQAVFFNLSGVLPKDSAMELLDESIKSTYSHKGPKVIESNQLAVSMANSLVTKVEYPESWAHTDEGGIKIKSNDANTPDFIEEIMNPVLELKGDNLPVSKFEPGGYQITGTTEFEKRGIAPSIPVWIPDKCTQCNYCAIVCPHAVVRPFLLDKNETKLAPPGFELRKAKGGSEVSGYNYTIQISPMDCTGCEVCVQSCPTDALVMAPFTEVAEENRPNWDYAIQLPEKGEIGDKFSVKGSQFQKPLMEFSGACAGCGETPYMKLATQLYGDKMVIANSSGCSSVWGGTSTTIPFTTTNEGKGPAWGRSLFEDTAEYGFGMMLATRQRRSKLKMEVASVLEQDDQMSSQLRAALNKWLLVSEDSVKNELVSSLIEKLLVEEMNNGPYLASLHAQKGMFQSQSLWIVGGDGWAYDIGYAGVDHILAKGENVNILVLDTEMYSNTGGQVSKATQLSTVTKFATGGKKHLKKDLGQIAMMYGDVYVASIAMGASYNQSVKAFEEAEAYPGTSLIIAYSPCIDWGIDMKYMMDAMKQAVDTGYWTLYRYDPSRIEKNLQPFQLDSKRLKGDLRDFLSQQNRFEQLVRKDPLKADTLHVRMKEVVEHKHKKYTVLAMDDLEKRDYYNLKAGDEVDTAKTVILYGSETGNAESLAGIFSLELKRRGIRPKCMAMDDFDFDELPDQDTVYIIAATCGQGEFPANCQEFWEQLSNSNLPADFLSNTKFSVFGLGDTSYVFFNETADLLNKRLEELGGQRIIEIGLGDDKDDERYETKWNEWMPTLWNAIGTPTPLAELLAPTYNLSMNVAGAVPEEIILPALGTKMLPMTNNKLLSPADYDRDIRHYEFDLTGTGIMYGVGECLGIYPHNNSEEVYEFCSQMGLDPETVLSLDDTQSRKGALPEIVTVRQLFQEVLDVFGRPSRRFYETLGIVATDEQEKKELEYLLTKDGADKLKELQKETVTYADLMKLYPSAKLPLEYFPDHISRIKPRLYSIASSQEMKSKILELCIVKDDWTTPSGRFHHGNCTRYLQKMSLHGKTDYVAGKINGAGITIPDSQAPPYVMVGLGTGIAPLRAMIEEREVARVKGEKVGPMALFFGARHQRSDYTYGDELEAYHNNGNGVLSVLSNAFSRDQAKKIYVQHRVAEHSTIVYDYLVKQKGYFYLCGPAGNVPAAVRSAISKALVECGNGEFNVDSAEKYITQMQIDGRYNIEAW